MAEEHSPNLRRHVARLALMLAPLLLIAVFAAGFIYAGAYNIGADAPHSNFVTMGIDELRERSIANHSRIVAVPADLDSAARRAMGAGLYGEMCSGCHLGPGLEKSEISQGLYPAAPELARAARRSPAEQFWIIKHGIKMTAMPAWGRTHDDQLIWDMVAFLRTLPGLSPDQYKAALASAPEDHDEMMKHMPAMAGAETPIADRATPALPPHGAPGHHH